MKLPLFLKGAKLGLVLKMFLSIDAVYVLVDMGE